MIIRDLAPDEVPFIGEMLYAALMWRPDGERPPIEWVLAHEQARIFHEGWGRAGDTALVADSDGQLVGLAWYRFFTDEVHGEGFVDEDTPELGIAVVDGFRGAGIGRALMLAMEDRARADGIRRISLSVDAGNPARRLYARLGYEPYEPGDDLGRMVRTVIEDAGP